MLEIGESREDEAENKEKEGEEDEYLEIVSTKRPLQKRKKLSEKLIQEVMLQKAVSILEERENEKNTRR